MSPLEALEAARTAGFQISVEGGDLVLESAAEPPVAVVDLLTEHKAGILAILRSGQAAGSAEERVAIAEFEVRADHIGAAPLLASTDTTGAASPDITGSASTDIISSAATNMTSPTCGGITGSLVIDGSSDITGSAATDMIGSASGDITGSRFGDIACSADSTAPLRPAQSWTSEDWLAVYDEKAGIAEYNHGLSRQEAEKRAVEHCMAEWLYQHPVTTDADDGCLTCGSTDLPNNPLLAIGLGGGLVWLHRECSTAWRVGRIAAAVASLAAMGIRISEGSSS
jgi:hypothetical protein